MWYLDKDVEENIIKNMEEFVKKDFRCDFWNQVPKNVPFLNFL